MDNGEEIQGLDEGWTFLGAKLTEWGSGFCAFIIGSEFLPVGRSVPILVVLWIGTTVGLARLRKMYPDEERGIANHLMTLMGFAPPGIPTPSFLQPRWSGGRLQKLAEDSHYVQLKLDKIFLEEQFEEEDEYEKSFATPTHSNVRKAS